MHGPVRPDDTKTNPRRRGIVVLLIGATSIGPLSINILMPAVPGLAAALSTDPASVQLTLSLFLVGLAVSQLVHGPLSDRFGRRPVMMAGFALTALASVAGFIATNITWLVIARVVQALGASTGIVLGRAIIRDLYDRDEAAAMLGWVTMAMVVVPMVSPTIGGALDTALGWRAIFAFIGLFSLALLIWVAIALPETNPDSERDTDGIGGLRRLIQEAAALVGDRIFNGYVFATAFATATFFSFLGGAPHVVVSIMGHTSAEYGIWFAVSGLAYMVGNYMAARWSTRFGSRVMSLWGLSLALVGGVGVLSCAFFAPIGWGPATIFLPQMLLALGNGFLLPNAIAGAVSVNPHAAGSAAGITGFLQMGVSAIAAQLVGHFMAGASTALPMAIMIATCALISLLMFVLLVKPQSQPA